MEGRVGTVASCLMGPSLDYLCLLLSLFLLQLVKAGLEFGSPLQYRGPSLASHPQPAHSTRIQLVDFLFFSSSTSFKPFVWKEDSRARMLSLPVLVSTLNPTSDSGTG